MVHFISRLGTQLSLENLQSLISEHGLVSSPVSKGSFLRVFPETWATEESLYRFQETFLKTTTNPGYFCSVEPSQRYADIRPRGLIGCLDREKLSEDLEVGLLERQFKGKGIEQTMLEPSFQCWYGFEEQGGRGLALLEQYLGLVRDIPGFSLIKDDTIAGQCFGSGYEVLMERWGTHADLMVTHQGLLLKGS